MREDLAHRIHEVRESRFFHDHMSVWLLVVTLAITTLNLVLLALHVPTERAHIPVQYSTLGFGNAGPPLGPWFTPFLIAGFALAATIVNGVLAYQTFGRSRVSSFLLLAGAGVVALFCLVIANALMLVVPQ